jgi:hypothetical protein
MSKYEYDTPELFLEKYAMKKDDLAVPAFFRLKGDEQNLENIEDVRNTISKLSLKDDDEIQSIIKVFPNLKPIDIAILWLISKYPVLTKEKIPRDTPISLKEVDRFSKKGEFTNVIRTIQTVEKFKEDIKKARKQIQQSHKLQEEAVKKLKTISGEVKTTDFIIDSLTSVVVLDLPNGENMLDIFDALNASSVIPFIVYVKTLFSGKKKKFYKIYTQLDHPLEWVDNPEYNQKDGIYFKILNTKVSRLSSRIKLENMYANGFWSESNELEISFGTEFNIDEKEMRIRVLNSIGNRLDYKISRLEQKQIKGTFKIYNTELVPYVFADLVETDPIFNSFLYFNESKKTVLSKPRFEPYFSIQGSINPSESLRLTITSQEDGLNVRIIHADTYQRATATKNILAKLFELYNKKRKSIEDIYNSFISLKKEKLQRREQKKDLKTKKRAAALLKARPDIFQKSGYSDQCQKSSQPYIVDEETAKTFDEHKKMFFKGSWFVCEPREEDDKDQTTIWPGLKQNTTKKSEEYRKTVPLLPCCYKDDMYIKKASQLRNYLEQEEHKEENIQPVEKKEDRHHILAFDKIVLNGRRGELPANWEKIFDILGVKKIKFGKGDKSKQYFPYLRYGVLESPDSFLHCVELATNKKYMYMDTDTRIKTIGNIKKNLLKSKPELKLVGKQSFYDENAIEEINDILGDAERYIDPDYFVDIVSSYYNCNIFLYITDDETPAGGIVIPRNSKAYLSKIDDTLQNILIMKHKTDHGNFPYQCELFCKISVDEYGKIKTTDFIFEADNVSKTAIELFKDANEVYVAGVDEKSWYKKYSPLLF